MASGTDHDRATVIASAPFGLLLVPLLGHQAGLVGAGAFLIGGLWLSPDLDTHSRPLRRWGPIGWIWWPYRHWIPHRSLFSHGPVIGMALRLMWVMVCALLSWQVCSGVLEAFSGPAMPTVQSLMGTLFQLVQHHPRPMLATALGLEASVWLHLLMDGDPLPVEWHRRHRNGRRR